MRTTIAMIAVCACASACILDPHRNQRPARLQVGTSARGFATVHAPSEPASGGTLARSAEPVMDTSFAQLGGVTGSAQFTLATPRHLYFGGEIEAGMLARRGSNIAGAYGIVGLETGGRRGSIGAELAGGWRALRYDLGARDVDTAIVEPRLRADLWIDPQFTVGAAAGLTLAVPGSEVGHTGWMAGVFLGVHSENFGMWPRSAN